MLAIDINDQIGNQMFAYASIKSLAMDIGLEFRYILRDTDLVNSNDSAYGHSFDSLFPIDRAEKLTSDCSFENKYNEPWPRTSNFQECIYELKADTLLKGHFQSPKYFAHRADQVRDKWFVLPQELVRRMTERKNEIMKHGHWKGLIGVHVRCGFDYSGRRLSRAYYHEAIRYTLAKYPKNSYGIVLFSDVPWLARLMLFPYKCFVNHGSLVDDMCLMSMCDAHIVSNSTFAWWGAWLSHSDNKHVCRPSIYPIGNGQLYPDDIFPEDWVQIPTTKMCCENSIDLAMRVVQKLGQRHR